MKELMSYIPKKYRPHIMDFYKDSEDDTYWLSLKCDGKYHFEEYCAEYTIHEDTIAEVLRVLRECIAEKRIENNRRKVWRPSFYNADKKIDLQEVKRKMKNISSNSIDETLFCIKNKITKNSLHARQRSIWRL